MGDFEGFRPSVGITADGVAGAGDLEVEPEAAADLLPLALTPRGEGLLLMDVQRECFLETERLLVRTPTRPEWQHSTQDIT